MVKSKRTGLALLVSCLLFFFFFLGRFPCSFSRANLKAQVTWDRLSDLAVLPPFLLIHFCRTPKARSICKQTGPGCSRGPEYMRNLRAFSRVPFSDFWPNELKIPAALQEGEGGDLDLGGELGTNAGHCFLRLRTPPPLIFYFLIYFFFFFRNKR